MFFSYNITPSFIWTTSRSYTIPRYAIRHPGQLSLLPHGGREMSTGESAVIFCGFGVNSTKAGWLIPYLDQRVGGTAGKHLDPSLTRAVPQRVWDKYRTHYKALYKCPVYLLTSSRAFLTQSFSINECSARLYGTTCWRCYLTTARWDL